MPEMRRAAEPSVEEIIAILNRSSLPTVIVEGKDDVILYRRIEDRYGSDCVSILPVGGRANVIGIFEARDRIFRSSPTLFICDKDLWVVSGIPLNYVNDVIALTDGFSIENDAIRDIEAIIMMTVAERAEFVHELAVIMRWYAKALSALDDGRSPEIDVHPDRFFRQRDIVAPSENEVNENELFKKYYDVVSEDYTRILRGKTLMALIIRQLSRGGREARHNSQSLLDLAGARPGPLIRRLFDWVGQRIS